MAALASREPDGAAFSWVNICPSYEAPRDNVGMSDPFCSHTYEDVDPRLKVCKSCGHKVWFKKEHVRGDASLGFVRHSYEVVT